MVSLVVLVRMRKEVGRGQAVPGRDGSQALARKGSGFAVGQRGRRLLPSQATDTPQEHGEEHHSYCEGPDQNPYTKG